MMRGAGRRDLMRWPAAAGMAAPMANGLVLRTGIRVQHARHLLRQGLPAAAVAIDSGFCDQSHLLRHFKRQCGVNPGHFALASCPAEASSDRNGSKESASGLMKNAELLAWRSSQIG